MTLFLDSPPQQSAGEAETFFQQQLEQVRGQVPEIKEKEENIYLVKEKPENQPKAQQLDQQNCLNGYHKMGYNPF